MKEHLLLQGWEPNVKDMNKNIDKYKNINTVKKYERAPIVIRLGATQRGMCWRTQFQKG